MKPNGETDPLTALARLLPEALDDDALRELASRLLPYLDEHASGSRDSRLLTIAAAAARVGVNVETIRRAIRAGDLVVAARIGQSPRLTEVAIDSWLAKTSPPTGATPPPRRRRSRRAGQPHELSLRAAFVNED